MNAQDKMNMKNKCHLLWVILIKHNPLFPGFFTCSSILFLSHWKRSYFRSTSEQNFKCYPHPGPTNPSNQTNFGNFKAKLSLRPTISHSTPLSKSLLWCGVLRELPYLGIVSPTDGDISTTFTRFYDLNGIGCVWKWWKGIRQIGAFA